MATEALGWWGVPLGIVAGTLRGSAPLFLIGVAIAPLMQWFFQSTRWGLLIRAVGDSPDAARAMGVSIFKVRLLCIITGSFLAGIGGSYICVEAEDGMLCGG